MQVAGWRHILAGEHTLLLAPTGSGKTLAAFLACVDRLARLSATAGGGVRVLYVSPLKALAYDIERNLRAPLEGIAEAARALGATDFRAPRIAVRTGDTPARDRRSQLRAPGDILITTPESLYLMLGSSARETLRLCDTVIVDEIHALAPTKRGAHLALSLERLEALTVRPPQRIGLSATQRPLDEIGRFLVGGARPVALVDTSEPPRIALAIEVPVDDMESARPEPRDDGTPGGQGIWASIHPRLVELVRQHRSTIIFVNSRRLCERLAESLNALDGGEAPLVRAHHGSVARAQREAIEQSLKDGEVRGLVATSSLELGIDMGAVDLVIQIESPGSVARGLQRIGRAGHAVGALSQGRIFPKHRADLLESAVVAERMLAGAVEPIRVPQNPLDVLAQQIVAMVSLEAWTVAALHETVTRAYGFGGLSRALLTGVLDMLSGHYPSDAFADLRPRLVWDRATDVLTARRDARLLALVNGGTIPDRGLYAVHLGVGGPRIGELDEEMVYECRAGETFLLGATSWRIVEITRDRVIVQPAPGEPGKMPFWRGEGPGRSLELGRALGAMLRETVAGVGGAAEGIARLAARFPLDARAARNLWGYIDGQRQATGTLPTDRELTIERFRDELGDWRVCILSPFGARVHAPWALALEARLGRAAGFEVETLWSDDGIVLRFADTGTPGPDAAALTPDPAEVSEAVLDQLPRSALFAAHFRENAARALLLPRRRPGARTPLWAQRLRSETLMAAALRHPAFPIVLETFRECVQDVFDLPALRVVLEAIARGEIRVTEVETASPSPFARSLAFAYVAAFMYEGDSPLAERKAQALTLDRTLLRELLGQDELSALLDPGVMDALEAELQAVEPERRAHHAEALHDLLRRIGDLTEAEVAERTTEDPRPWLAALMESGRAAWVTVASQPRVIAAEDVGRYRDGLGALPPSAGVPASFLEPVPNARVGLVARFARTHGPFVAGRVAERFGLAPGDVEGLLRTLEADGTLVEGSFRTGLGEGGHDWCHSEVLRILRRRTLARLRSQVAPVGAAVFARFLADWHGVQMSSWSPSSSPSPSNWPSPAPAGAEARSSSSPEAPPAGEGESRRGQRLWEAVSKLEGMFLPFSDLERRILPARIPDFEGAELDALGALGEICWVASGALGRGDGRIALYRRDRIRLLLDPPPAPDAGAPPLQRLLFATLQASGASFFAQLRGALSPEISTDEVLAALWELVWAGLVTNDTFQPLRALAAPRPRASTTRHPGRGDRGWAAEAAGRWSTVGSLLSPPVTASRTGGGDALPAAPPAVTDTERLHARARMLLDRYGVVSRETVAAEGSRGGFSELARVLRAMEDAGKVRRGFFVDGLGGAQFALPNAVERLRAARSPEAEASAAASGPGATPAGAASASAPVLVAVLAAVDPANPYGALLPWPGPKGAPPSAGLGIAPAEVRDTDVHRRPLDEADDAEEVAPARRAAGARAVLVEGAPVLFIEGGGRALRVFSGADHHTDTELAPAVAGLRHALQRRGGRSRALRIERVNGGPALRSALSEKLRRAGFRLEPGALVLDPASR